MPKWTKGELAIMWLIVGAALIATSKQAFGGAWALEIVILGALMVAYGGYLGWKHIRVDKDSDTASSDLEPEVPSDDAPDKDV